MQKSRDQTQDVHLYFTDYEKTFDRVKHTKLIKLLYEQGLDQNVINLNLYWVQTASIRVEEKLTTNIPIKRGMGQGCVLSPTIFNMHSEKLFQKTLENIQEGIKVNRGFVNNIRYTDTIIMANNQEGVQKCINAITRDKQRKNKNNGYF